MTDGCEMGRQEWDSGCTRWVSDSFRNFGGVFDSIGAFPLACLYLFFFKHLMVGMAFVGPAEHLAPAKDQRSEVQTGRPISSNFNIHSKNRPVLRGWWPSGVQRRVQYASSKHSEASKRGFDSPTCGFSKT